MICTHAWMDHMATEIFFDVPGLPKQFHGLEIFSRSRAKVANNICLIDFQVSWVSHCNFRLGLQARGICFLRLWDPGPQLGEPGGLAANAWYLKTK